MDFLAWAEQQAEALRGATDLESRGVDVQNLVEEVEALARDEFRKFEDSLRSAVSRLIRAAFEPDADAARGALSDVTCLLREAKQRAGPTALARMTPDRIWAEAEALLPEGSLPDGPGPCPFATGNFLLGEFDLRRALERIRELPCDG